MENIKVSSTVRSPWTTFSNHRNVTVTEVGLPTIVLSASPPADGRYAELPLEGDGEMRAVLEATVDECYL